MRGFRPKGFTAAGSILVTGFVVISLWKMVSRATAPLHADVDTFSTLPSNQNARCQHLPGADEMLVIMKTGATELIDKFPVHLRTSLTCYPNYLVFSDHEEVFHGVQIRDALNTVSPEIRSHHEDFELYRRLRESGRESLALTELSGAESKLDDGSGKPSRPGWKLDKWKFLPMLNQTYNLYPSMKWYMFVETDTNLFWATLLKFTQQLDHTRPYYMGSQNWIGDVEFAHGGSGFLVSNSALQLVVDEYIHHQKEWEDFTGIHWAGDCIAGKAFRDSGSPLTRTWPIMQGDHPGAFPWGENGPRNEPRWCYPTATYHHLAADVVEEMWDFEQQWMAKGGLQKQDHLLFKDVFKLYIMPHMRASKRKWDNSCVDEQKNAKDLNSCIDACEKDSACLQYRFDPERKECKTSKDPMLGEKAPLTDLRSGWMYERIEKWTYAQPKCKKMLWIAEN